MFFIGRGIDSITSLEASLKLKETSEVQNLLKELLTEYVLETTLTPERNKINVFLVLGVNGVGKTTSVAKMANFYKKEFNELDFVKLLDIYKNNVHISEEEFVSKVTNTVQEKVYNI